jgi:hypothetical protein
MVNLNGQALIALSELAQKILRGLDQCRMPTTFLLGLNAPTRAAATARLELATVFLDTKVLLASEQCAPTIATTEELAGPRSTLHRKSVVPIPSLGML